MFIEGIYRWIYSTPESHFISHHIFYKHGMPLAFKNNSMACGMKFGKYLSHGIVAQNNFRRIIIKIPLNFPHFKIHPAKS